MTTLYLGVSAPDAATKRALNGARVGVFLSRVSYRPWRQDTFLDSARWGLDSGAVSGLVDLDEYIVDVRHARGRVNPPADLFALDVIGAWRASLRNYDKLRALGLDVIPTWHVGTPEHVLLTLAREYPKLAIGGVVSSRLRGGRLIGLLTQAFARVWPKRIHGFGILGHSALFAVPFHTVDGTGWSRARRFGEWAGRHYKQKMYCDAGVIDLTPQVRYFEDLQDRLKARWAKELTEL